MGNRQKIAPHLVAAENVTLHGEDKVMLKSVTLENFKSFGEPTTVPLRPITVLVGANNSGKSNFLSFPRFVRSSALGQPGEGLLAAGGLPFLLHRPLPPDDVGPKMSFRWDSTLGSYSSSLEVRADRLWQIDEQMTIDGKSTWRKATAPQGLQIAVDMVSGGSAVFDAIEPFTGLALYERGHRLRPTGMASVAGEVLNSRFVRLELPALRQDAQVVNSPRMLANGEGLPAEVGNWQGADKARVREMDDFLSSCLPEFESAYAIAAPRKVGHLRFWIRQKDGQEFDAEHLSDGVLCFVGLSVHAVSAGPGSLMLVEEPEQSIHPRRLHQYVELIRTIAKKRNCQFILATHSPVLLNEFRDEPEAILVFRRGRSGTRVQRVADDSSLMESLERVDPADPGQGKGTLGFMLQDGFFSTED